MSRGLERARFLLSLSHKLNKMTLALAENGVRGRKSAVLVLGRRCLCRHPSHPCASRSIA